MSKNLIYFLLILIFFLSLFLRFYKLGQIPPSLDWDEASLGYNSYTILNTGQDEYGNSWPLSIRSFNDYKASVYVYLSLIPIKLFSLNEFSIRFVSAFFGSLTILITFFLIREICKLDKNLSQKEVNTLSLLVSLFLAISPWHLQVSRVAFEANLALFFFTLGIFVFILGIKKNIFLPLSILFFGISMFTYHSCRIVVPIFIVGMTVFYRKKIFVKNFYQFLAALLLLLFLGLQIYSLKLGSYKRFESTSIFAQKTDFISFGKKILNNYFIHYDFNFLFIKGDPQSRHHGLGLAQLYLWELPFVVAGIVFCIKNKFASNKIIFLWFLIAPLASALTKDVPNAVRSLLFLPTFQFFTAYGLFSVYKLIKRLLPKLLFVSSACCICILSFSYYLHMYYVHGPIETSQNWLYGYKQLVEFINKREGNYQKIIVTTAYDQPYIYFLFYEKEFPISFNNGEFYKGFRNLEFRPINWQQDKNLKNVLIAGTDKEIPEDIQTVEKINFLDGETAFKIVKL